MFRDFPSVETPWGASDHAEDFGPDLTFYGTPSHGGFHATGEVAAKIRSTFPGFDPFAHRNGATGPGLWLEEDCDWALACLALPDRFKPRDVVNAIQTAEFWFFKKNPGAGWSVPPAALERAALAPLELEAVR